MSCGEVNQVLFLLNEKNEFRDCDGLVERVWVVRSKQEDETVSGYSKTAQARAFKNLLRI